MTKALLKRLAAVEQRLRAKDADLSTLSDEELEAMLSKHLSMCSDAELEAMIGAHPPKIVRTGSGADPVNSVRTGN